MYSPIFNANLDNLSTMKITNYKNISEPMIAYADITKVEITPPHVRTRSVS